MTSESDVLTPPRRAGSVRRTSSIDTHWLQGAAGPRRMGGRARDVRSATPKGKPEILAHDAVEIVASPDRRIISIAASREASAVQQLVGSKAGRGFREHLAEVLPREVAEGTPLHLLLDDFPGASLVSAWALHAVDPPPTRDAQRAAMVGICIGFREGSAALNPSRVGAPPGVPVPPLARPDDPLGWHDLEERGQLSMRRARYIDVWNDAGVIHMDLGFQDSAFLPRQGRVAVHEYWLRAMADARSLELVEIAAHPRVVPFGECHAAPANLAGLIGAPLANLRREVALRLFGDRGCTHLNDIGRSMADVPHLVKLLEATEPTVSD